MAAQRIRQLGDPILREISQSVTSAEDAHTLINDLRDTLHEFQRTHGFGRGISAVQIGEARRVIYMEFEGKVYAMMNPEVEQHSAETFVLWDDCFSFPDLLVKVERWQRIRVCFTDLEGTTQVVDAEGALSELLQHELDHLEGVLCIDRALDGMSLCTREEYERRYAASAKG